MKDKYGVIYGKIEWTNESKTNVIFKESNKDEAEYALTTNNDYYDKSVTVEDYLFQITKKIYLILYVKTQ